MKIVIITVGKKHDPKLAPAIDDYSKRLTTKHVSWQVIPSQHASTKHRQQQAESAAIVAQFRSDDYIVLLDETGQQLTNEQLDGFIVERQNRSTSRLVFIIGGSYGVDAALVQKAHVVWSLSHLVLPHQVVRLILIEQLYRTFSSLDGSRYHHGN